MRNLRWEEALETDTNDLISAADLVISMSQSSTFIEALLNGVPSVAMDMTGRNWEPSVGRGACLVVDNPRDLSELVSEVLSRGIPRGVWEHTMQRVAWNYGEIDGRELDRIRSIVASASLPTEALRQPAALRKPGVFW
jgi:hypothetical protein